MKLPRFAAHANDGLLVRLRVTPRARQAAIGDLAIDPDGSAALKVAVNALPEDGKANTAVRTLLARSWRVPKSTLSLQQGGAARNKVLHIAGDPMVLQTRLSEWWQKHAGRHAN